MSNTEVIVYLNKMLGRTEDPTETRVLLRAINAVSCYRNCKRCMHRVEKSKYSYCELCGCDFEPKPIPVEVENEVQ